MSAVPAWKRLGLKLKASDGSSPAVAPSTTSTPSAARQPVPAPATSALKRKLPSQQQSFNNQNAYPTQNKRFRSDAPTQAGQQRKSVSFSQETKTNSVTDAAAKEKKREKKKAKKAKQASKKSAEQSKNKSDTNLEPSLAYLRQWATDRDSWKFNKNHQTLLREYSFIRASP